MRANERMSTRELYPILPGRFARDLVLCWGVIALTIAAAMRLDWWFYPIACLIIGNRQTVLLLLTHEAVHRTFIADHVWNDRVGRWLCGFPVLISLSKYRYLHFLHHNNVGKPSRDPDLHLYDYVPMSPWSLGFKLLLNVLTLRLFVLFLGYLTEWPETISRRRNWLGQLAAFSKGSDFFAFQFFYIALFAVLILTGHVGDYFLYFFIPLLVVMQPMTLIGGAVQHGPLSDHHGEEKSRTLTGPKWLTEILSPCDINFHGEHHLNASVPHYWLRQFSKDLEAQGRGIVWKESYLTAFRRLFASSEPPPARFLERLKTRSS